MKAKWVNFKELREKLDFEAVLRHYGVEVKRKGEQHLGYCPLPSHQGKRNSPSFSANLARGIFKCFGCGAQGNVLEFAARMEKVDLEDGAAFRKVALTLQTRFCPETKGKALAGKSGGEVKVPERDESNVVVNPLLDFELKGLDQRHPYLLERGFRAETITHFGVGFCSRGLLKDRVAIPLHDSEGNLIGYAGRVVDDAKITEDNPRYRFPSKRERDGKIIEFKKSMFLYNGFRMKMPVDDLVVVEGFASVWWLHQHNRLDVVATMGADCSERQSELIATLVKTGGRVWVLSDGDEAGNRFAQSVVLQVSLHRFIRSVRCGSGRQPTDLSKEDLKRCFVV